MRVSVVLAGALLVTGCAQQVKQVWIRTDGQRGVGNPAFAQQFEIDKTVCVGEMQKANLSGVAVHGGGLAGLAVAMERDAAADDVQKGCMAQRGYVLVPEDQADARAAAYAAASRPPPPASPAPSQRRPPKPATAAPGT
jgi:hypothetical protein